MVAYLLFVFALVSAVTAENQKLVAKVFLTEPLRKNNIQGNITFTQVDDQKVHVEGVVIGLPAGRYGFHVHEKGDLSGGCASAGPHFNPEKKQHGHPNDQNRHVGDLGNVVFNEDSVATIDFMDTMIALYGPHCILGRSIVLHESDDDYGRTDHPDSKTTGNAGGRAACGVVGIVDPVTPWNSSGTISASILLIASILTLIMY
ncbi:superoxide dismutase [Cu-Zn] 5-like [Pieris rapae]|uniref:superoxide dismutase [Cu-Zn] 5-like n=1 Tax=Pieris rapae TaxID=64459 RepID=UPI001E280E6E|nr:superoxide dismutase [Cu-Zn] 5-like [Pieris rapae]